MGKDNTLRAHAMLPNAKIVATHMEAINHCILPRKELEEFLMIIKLLSLFSSQRMVKRTAFSSCLLI